MNCHRGKLSLAIFHHLSLVYHQASEDGKVQQTRWYPLDNLRVACPKKNSYLHMGNLVIIGNDIYYVEPQPDDFKIVWLCNKDP